MRDDFPLIVAYSQYRSVLACMGPSGQGPSSFSSIRSVLACTGAGVSTRVWGTPVRTVEKPRFIIIGEARTPSIRPMSMWT